MLARAAATLPPDEHVYADAMLDEQAQREEVAFPGFEQQTIYRIEKFMRRRPLVFFVAIAADDTAEILSGRPEAFNTLARQAGVQVAVEAEAVDLLRFFIRTTRPDRRLGMPHVLHLVVTNEGALTALTEVQLAVLGGAAVAARLSARGAVTAVVYPNNDFDAPGGTRFEAGLL